ncbi:hypothetical protein H312_01226 [Anncaliia algerae PRA339]|uniref:Dolichol-phosphate mannosyltransferase subunit 1 n=1 Tax=Anncaliia algerae PRA339 TaxID=1288291 RepID=A0A059F2B8_9MICR|nr:hypothetical protein H312_01226 [Anncaliia algerae PRA339]
MYNIILPTYNEKENIKILVPMINQYFLSIDTVYKIIVVDDNSPDGTAGEVEKLMEKYPIELIKRKGKEGLGTAYIAAIEYCKFDYIIIMDADMSHDPIYILEFIGLQQKRSCDIVLSTRYSKGGGVTGWSFKRKLISRTANNLASIVLNLNISDLTGSFRLYKRNVLISLLNEVYSCGYSIQMELAFYASKNKYRIEECPIIFYDRFNGVSKCGITEIFLFLKVILLLFCRC